MKKLLLLLFLFAERQVLADERPNILWIFSEDLSPYMGCYDDPINRGYTPAIDKLAKECLSRGEHSKCSQSKNL